MHWNDSLCCLTLTAPLRNQLCLEIPETSLSILTPLLHHPCIISIDARDILDINIDK
jgi:hypothetical protein